jgi:hypothetical protein
MTANFSRGVAVRTGDAPLGAQWKTRDGDEADESKKPAHVRTPLCAGLYREGTAVGRSQREEERSGV